MAQYSPEELGFVDEVSEDERLAFISKPSVEI
jgi:hypothetical protein